MTDTLTHLLAVQDLDTSITQMQHRRDALPETTGLAAVEGELAVLQIDRAEAEARRAVLARPRRRTSRCRSPRSPSAATTWRSACTPPPAPSGRDLQAMNEEVKHLTERRAELEEQELVVMLDLDPIDAELGRAAGAARPARGARQGAARPGRARPPRDRRRHSPRPSGTRAAEAAQLPSALSDRYEKLRTHLKGTGAARLIKNHCDGCHLELSSVEVERIRALPPGEVATCEQCGRILVPA